MADLTAIILTRNEEINIADCIKSLDGFAKRCVVVDSFSTDKTVQIARDMGAEVVQHAFESHSRQFNWALDNIKIDTAWVLRIDADERMTPGVVREATEVMENADEDLCGITMQAVMYMLDKPLKHGMAKKRKMMIFRNGAARSEERNIDEHTVLLRGRNVSIKAMFEHYDFKSIDHFVRKLNWYASREVMDVMEDNFAGTAEKMQDKKISRTRKLKGGVFYKAPMFIRAWMLFIYCYIFRLGFLDGKEGLIYNFLYAYMYRFVVDAKLYEAKKTGKYDQRLRALD